MKHLHKFASVLLALAMALSLMVPAFAEGNTQPPTTKASVNIENPLENHTYTAYQIFAGTQAESEGALADVEWGSAINDVAFLAALKASDKFGDTNPFADCKTAAEVAAAISEAGYGDNSAQAIALAQIAYDNLKQDATGTPVVNGTAKDLPTGYYLIVDTTENLTGENIVYNAALLQLTKDITITTKVSVPQVDKEVKENSTQEYEETADYSIGDTVPFQFTATIPDMSQFETYKYVFHDTMSEGLTFEPESVKVAVGPSEVNANSYSVVTENLEDGCTFEIVFTDLKAALAQVTNAVAGGEIVVTFDATLNSKATVGISGNSNKVKLEYSNNPNDDGDGNPPTGTTPEDEVLVFTYELDTNKVDGNDTTKTLKDAEFHLSKVVEDENGEKVTVWAVVDTENKITKWVEAKEGEEGYVAADADGNLNETAYAGSTLTSGDDGMFKVLGLDAGDYELLETKAPAGYNTPKEPFAVTITRTLVNTDGSESYKDLNVTVGGKAGTGDNENGIVTGTIANNQGATLPETGGIGTTIFYTVGGILVAGAVILLVTKKRMSAEK